MNLRGIRLVGKGRDEVKQETIGLRVCGLCIPAFGAGCHLGFYLVYALHLG